MEESKSRSTGDPLYTLSTVPVDNLVSNILSQAQGHRLDGSNHKSKHDSSLWNSGQRSVGSMYSDNTEFSNQEVGIHFDC